MIFSFKAVMNFPRHTNIVIVSERQKSNSESIHPLPNNLLFWSPIRPNYWITSDMWNVRWTGKGRLYNFENSAMTLGKKNYRRVWMVWSRARFEKTFLSLEFLKSFPMTYEIWEVSVTKICQQWYLNTDHQLTIQ